MAVTIEGGGGVWRNDSEYVLDQQKLSDRPAWLDEIDGYRERYAGSEDSIIRVFQCPWSYRIEAREYILGYNYTELSPGVLPADVALAKDFNARIAGGLNKPVARLRRVIPMQDPERPWLFATDCELIEGRGAWVDSPFSTVKDERGEVVKNADGSALLARAVHYVDNDQHGNVATENRAGDVAPALRFGPTNKFSDGKAVLRATFRALDYTVLSDHALDGLGGGEHRRYLSRDEEYGIQAVPLARLASASALQLRFTTDPDGVAGVPPAGILNQIIPEAGVIQQPLATLNYTWQKVPDRPMAAYARVVGRVNADAFDGIGGVPLYPKGTLLCLPWRTKRRRGPTGRVEWTIQFRFSFRATPWNHFLAADGQYYLATFSAATGDPNGRRVYQSANFADLFIPPPPVAYIS